MKKNILKLLGIVSIAAVMVLALSTVNLGTGSVVEAGNKTKAENDSKDGGGYTEADGTNLFWD